MVIDLFYGVGNPDGGKAGTAAECTPSNPTDGTADLDLDKAGTSLKGAVTPMADILQAVSKDYSFEPGTISEGLVTDTLH